MNTIDCGNFKIVTPDEYEKVPLPGFKAWYDGLMLNPPQTQAKLCGIVKGKLSYCCLGILSKSQGRLKKIGDYWFDNEQSPGGLSEDNPLFNVFGELGRLPKDCQVIDLFYRKATSFAGMNDSLEMTMPEIAEVLNHLYKE